MDAAEEFHRNVTELFKKTQEPCGPENYRGRTFPRSDDYVLLHEEEQHLADHLAFLAQAQEGPDFVSAVMLEECRNPPSLTVRLAANKSPPARVVQGLREVLEAVDLCAQSGIKSDLHKSAIFTKIVALSQDRLYSRIRSSRAKKRKWPPLSAQLATPLYVKVQSLLASVSSQLAESTNSFGPLVERLNSFMESLKEIDTQGSKAQIELLMVAITRSFELSHLQPSKSLETHFQTIGFTLDPSQTRTVLEIDKISRYLEVCNDFIRLSRKSRCRALFSKIHLEVLAAPPASRPPGSTMSCHIHAEVQLIMFYEEYSKEPPPRTIGSSKSACFLCDLFIRKHGKYELSHSHKRLYEPWTLPSQWTEEKHKEKFEQIFREMNVELVHLILTYERPPLYQGNGPESRAHLLVLPHGTALTSPTGSIFSAVTSRAAETNRSVGLQNLSVSLLAVNSIRSVSTTRSNYYFQDLPIKINISASTTCCILLVGQVDYIFDLEEVKSSELLISEVEKDQVSSESPRIDIRELSSSYERRIESGISPQAVTFCVHDAEKYELRVTMKLDTVSQR